MKQSLLALVFVLVFALAMRAQNVGVGTAVPASKLEVKGVSGDENSIGSLRLTNGTGSTELRFGTLDGTRSWLQTNSTLPLSINRLGNNVILNETGGSVGVGTATPVQKLEVNGRTVFHNGGSTYNNAGAAEVQIGYALSNSGSVGEVARLALQPFGHTGGPFLFFNRDNASSAFLDIRYGTDNLVSIIHNGNFGIGTQTPAAKLHVIGAGVPQALIDQANGHSVLDIRTTDATNFAQSLRFYRGGVHQGEIYTANGDQKLRFYINGGDRMLIDNTGKVQIPALNASSAVYTDGSKNLTTSAPSTGALGYWTRTGTYLYPTTLTDYVGVGVTNPTTILDVRRPDNSNGDAIAFGTQSYVMGRLGETSSTNKVYLANTYNHDESYIDFRLKGTAEANSKMVIKGNGNVGIGTTDPGGSYRLNVQQGSLNSLFQSTSDAQVELKGTDQWAGLKWSDVGGTDYTWFWGATGTWAIGSGGSTVSGKKLHIHGGTSIGTSYVQSSVPSEGLAVEGSLGVGTNSPSAKMHVTGGGAILGTVSSGSVNRTFTILNDGQSQINFGSYPWDWSPALQIQNNDNTRFIWINPGGSSGYNYDSRFYAANSGLDFFTGSNAFAATLTATGRLGIGTEDPAQKLDVQGGYAMISDIVGGSNDTKAFIEGGNGIAYFGGLGNQRAAFGNAETWETLVADGGNVGIGTSSPGARLDVQGVSGVRIGYNTYDGNLVFGNNSSWKSGIRTYDNGLAEMRIWHINGSGKIILATGYNGDQSTVMPSDGVGIYGNRLGVGTFTPSYKLHVIGQVYASTGNVLSDYSTVNQVLEQTNSSYNAGIALRNTTYGDGGVLFGRSNSGGLNAGSITNWTGYVGMYASNFTTQSDITVKKDVQYLNSNDFETCLQQIRNIQSIRYRYLSESATKEDDKQYRPNLHLGVVAQSLPVEVVDTMDRYASGPEGGQILGVSLGDMDGLMVAGMKALDQKNQVLEKQIEELKREIEALKKNK